MNLRVQSEKIVGLSYGLNTNWLKGESVNTLLWGNDKEGLYSSFAGAATRTKQVVGNVDPFVEYLTSKGSRHSLKGRWQKLDNDNDNDQGNFSDVVYGEYQVQQHFDSLGIKNFTATGGLVSIFTSSEANLYSGGSSDGVNKSKNLAAFVQLDKKFLDKLNVSLGVRYEYFDINGDSESRPVFRGGLNYQAARATFVRASYGQGYRFPTIAEKHIRTAVGAINIYPNEQLTSESSYNAEIGVKQGIKIGGFLGFVDAAFFLQEYEDFIEFTFGQWSANPGLDNLFGLGFKSVNTGNSRVTGMDLSVMGTGKIGVIGLTVLAGYTYTKPISLTPDHIYGRSAADPTSPWFFPGFDEVTYQSTSSNPDNDILKYRLQHLVRTDVQFDYEAISFGVSVRANSHMQNIDGIFEDLDNPDIDPTIPLGTLSWREAHTTGDTIIDTRLSYQVNETHKIALVVNNLLNREYAIRPLAIEGPRKTTLQYTLTF
ncbi:MAG: TonB-dependent receptor [Flavobacteriales bacterium]|nr:TonB-dependent receptor [Flavobacteriales bacterium]